jgi:hypothetical protein
MPRLVPYAGRTHSFHADANILCPDAGHLPAFEPRNNVSIELPGGGGFRSQFLDGYDNVDGLSFKSAYMHVAGTRSLKAGSGWTTLATVFVTGLSIKSVVTADVVFAQICTEHPVKGYVLSVTFLGTRFEDLRIDGSKLDPVFDLDVCGPKPDGDNPYIQDAGFLSRVSQQYQQASSQPGLSDWAREQYHWSLPAVRQQGKVECSLVASVPQAGISFGHLIEVAGLGRISMAELSVDRASFHLTMLGLQSDTASGIKIINADANGVTRP